MPRVTLNSFQGPAGRPLDRRKPGCWTKFSMTAEGLPFRSSRAAAEPVEAAHPPPPCRPIFNAKTQRRKERGALLIAPCWRHGGGPGWAESVQPAESSRLRVFAFQKWVRTEMSKTRPEPRPTGSLTAHPE